MNSSESGKEVFSSGQAEVNKRIKDVYGLSGEWLHGLLDVSRWHTRWNSAHDATDLLRYGYLTLIRSITTSHLEAKPHDELEEILRKAVDKAIEEIKEAKVRAVLDNCMSEIEKTRGRMLEQQEEIERLTIEARSILSNLQST